MQCGERGTGQESRMEGGWGGGGTRYTDLCNVEKEGQDKKDGWK